MWRVCVRMHVCVLGVWSVLSSCMFQTAPTCALPGSGISKNFLSSLDQEAQRWGWLKTWPRASCGKAMPAGVCVAERVGVKCVGSCGMSHLCSNETYSDCFARKCMNVWVRHTRTVVQMCA